jgi:hypothetical protein
MLISLAISDLPSASTSSISSATGRSASCATSDAALLHLSGSDQSEDTVISVCTASSPL